MNKYTLRMNKNKKVIALILAVLLMAMICVITPACALIDNPNGGDDNTGGGKGNNTELIFEDDYMVGMFLVVCDYSGEAHTTYPTDDFNDENAWYMYQKKNIVQTDIGEETFLSCEIQGDFFVEGIGITNNGAAPNGKLELGAAFYYTYELINQSLYVGHVYQTKENEYYADDGNRYVFSGYGKIIASINQKLTASRTNTDGSKEEISYEGKFSVSMQLIDYLTDARILEFDSGNNLINTTLLDLTKEYGGIKTFDVLPECEYAIIEKDYEVMYESDYYMMAKGTTYTERVLIEKRSNDKSDLLHIPKGNGFVRSQRITINFDGNPSE